MSAAPATSRPSSRRQTLWTLLAVAIALPLLGAVGWWWYSTHERVEEEIELPRTGEITYNPLYVLGLALREDGWTVDMRQRLDSRKATLGPRDTVVVLNDPGRMSQIDADTLLDWVDGGGHLVVRTPPSGMVDSLFPRQSRLEAGAGRQDTLFEALDVMLAKAPRPCVPLLVDGEESHVEFCGGQRFGTGAIGPLHRWKDENGHLVYARLPYGEGTVDVIAGLDFMTNDKLRDGPHIVLARQLLEPNWKAGTAHLLYAAEMPSFWRWLAANSWMAWLPLLLALLAWLWSRMQRFGPQLPSPIGERRSLLEHVTASGEHIYRYGYGHVLHAAVRAAFLARLRRRDPQAAALEGDAQAALIAERFKDTLTVSADDVRIALSAPPARDHAAFRSRIATLIRLRNQL
ncbi:DUF4350 domain-containing protein [Marilutibacter alkalisoli]|uniref:DUF4350 domain-containing protein n=1 Tax=Marilutibacter alkalisoli TaxID=2591633 RepID=A0A514BW07_9GAMM|nr:DUF4350 domain-containing protein [Lysobacter alkalisoli]QDH71571.1 DUF4350 domain-containing protein [Lysobacter alkalisoli]